MPVSNSQQLNIGLIWNFREDTEELGGEHIDTYR